MQKGHLVTWRRNFNKASRDSIKLWQDDRDVPRSTGARHDLLNDAARYRRWLTLSTRDAFLRRSCILDSWTTTLLIDLSFYEVQHAVKRVAVPGVLFATGLRSEFSSTFTQVSFHYCCSSNVKQGWNDTWVHSDNDERGLTYRVTVAGYSNVFVLKRRSLTKCF